MSQTSSDSSGSSCGCGCFNAIPATLTSMLGYHIHGSVIFAILYWIFWPIAILKWIVFHEVNLTTIKQAFSWFFQ